MTASEREALVARVREMCDNPPVVTEIDLLSEVVIGIADLRALVSEVERLREDAARLDYMDAQRNWTRWMGRDTGDGYTVWPVSGNDSFRAAIDAARTTGGTNGSL